MGLGAWGLGIGGAKGLGYWGMGIGVTRGLGAGNKWGQGTGGGE